MRSVGDRLILGDSHFLDRFRVNRVSFNRLSKSFKNMGCRDLIRVHPNAIDSVTVAKRIVGPSVIDRWIRRALKRRYLCCKRCIDGDVNPRRRTHARKFSVVVRVRIRDLIPKCLLFYKWQKSDETTEPMLVLSLIHI